MYNIYIHHDTANHTALKNVTRHSLSNRIANEWNDLLLVIDYPSSNIFKNKLDRWLQKCNMIILQQ